MGEVETYLLYKPAKPKVTTCHAKDVHTNRTCCSQNSQFGVSTASSYCNEPTFFKGEEGGRKEKKRLRGARVGSARHKASSHEVCHQELRRGGSLDPSAC
jgi:hypothetical protein